MNLKKYLTDLVLTFAIVLVVSTVVTFLYNLVAHGQGVADWETAFRLAIIMGVALPWLQQREKKNKDIAP